MIFLSHNWKDKPVVEQVALRLRNIFGQNNVFYDSWSIQSGDGIKVNVLNEAMHLDSDQTGAPLNTGLKKLMLL